MNSFFKKNKLILIPVCAFLFTNCVKRVTRVNSNEIIDISGRWNDTDARITAEEMINTILNAEWLHDFNKIHNHSIINDSNEKNNPQSIVSPKFKKPVIVVGEIKNKSSEHIESDTFIKDIERELINKRAVRIITNSLLREKLREERSSQIGYSTQESQKKFGKELGADFMIFGTINTIVDASKDDRASVYQVDLEIVDLETGEKVCIASKKIKKYLSSSKRVKKYQKGKLPSS